MKTGFEKVCQKSGLLNFIFRNLETGDFLNHLEDEIPSGKDSFDLATLEKQMVSFSEQIKVTASNRRQKYQFWLVTDGSLTENDSDEFEKAIERLDDASYDVSFVYFHTNADECPVISKWASDYVHFNCENILKVFRQTFEASPTANNFQLCLSDKVSIIVKVHNFLRHVFLAIVRGLKTEILEIYWFDFAKDIYSGQKSGR